MDSQACLWACEGVSIDEEGRPTLKVAGTIPWQRALECIKQEKAAVFAPLCILIALQCGQPHAATTMSALLSWTRSKLSKLWKILKAKAVF